jgi:hypothetical protein
MIVGKLIVGKMIVGKLIVGKMNQTPLYYLACLDINND